MNAPKPATYKLSKSRLMQHRQCPRRLWLFTHRPELAEDDLNAQAAMASGTNVGEVARTLYPEGVLIESGNLTDDLNATTSLLNAAPRPLFEATLSANDVLVRVDLLLPTPTATYRLVEVKSSTSVKRYHLDDAAIQTWVAQNAGVAIAGTDIAHINNQFTYLGGDDYAGLFTHTDISLQVAERLPQISGWINAAQSTLAGSEPEILPGAQCNDPFSCPFIAHCQPVKTDAPEYPVTLLPRASRVHRELLAAGYEDLRDVPDQMLNHPLHQKIQRLSRSGSAEITAEGTTFARSLPYPRYYLDFETIAFAIPRWIGTRPYRQIPFQFSCHVAPCPGTLMPFSFLSTDGEDPRRAFIKALIAAVNPEICTKPGQAPGPVFVYNAAFERSRINELAASFPEFTDALTALNARIVDLLPVTRAHYYHPAMRGSWSLKAVLPTIGVDLDYSSLAVANGGMAQEAYLDIINPETPFEQKEKLRQDLLDYCALDTYGLVRLVERLAQG
jgi:hypothetical protein